MHRKHLAGAALVALAGLHHSAEAQEGLSSKAHLACEAVLCLSTGSPPGECANALRHYFSITHRRPSETLRRRASFLRLCPVGQQDASMSGLIRIQSQAAGKCDAEALNASQRRVTGLGENDFAIGNRLPAYCDAYFAHAYSDWANVLPRYVGVPERGGFWVPAHDHAKAQGEYAARIVAEDAARNSSAGR